MKIKVIPILILLISFSCSEVSQKSDEIESPFPNKEEFYGSDIDFGEIKWFEQIKSKIIDFKIDLRGEFIFLLTEDKFLYRTDFVDLDNFEKIKLNQGEKILIGTESIGLMDYNSIDSLIYFTEFNFNLTKIDEDIINIGRRSNEGDIQYSFYMKNDSVYNLVHDFNTVAILTDNGFIYDKINFLDLENGNKYNIEYGSCTTLQLGGVTILDLANYDYLNCNNNSPIKIYNNTIYLRDNGIEYVKTINESVDTFKISTDELYSINNFTKKGAYLFNNNILHWILLKNIHSSK